MREPGGRISRETGTKGKGEQARQELDVKGLHSGDRLMVNLYKAHLLGTSHIIAPTES
jgi:hypothetical protein